MRRKKRAEKKVRTVQSGFIARLGASIVILRLDDCSCAIELDPIFHKHCTLETDSVKHREPKNAVHTYTSNQ